ncbi:MAG TPA: flagellar basal body-associated FliL family protein [Rhizomicrobium sp.]|jgi:flagellar FliL protein
MAKDEETETDTGADAPKKGFVKKLLGNKKLLIIVVAALVLLIGGGGGAYFFLFASAPSDKDKLAAAAPPIPVVPPNIAFFDMPDIVVNIQSADGSPAYLKLSLSLEIAAADEKAALTALVPRIVDQFQGYLRELRVDDLHGSAGVLRLKEELLRRINVAAAPYPVKDVLLKEMIVQ